MPKRMKIAKVDKNQNELFKTAEALGALVTDTHTINNFVDGVFVYRLKTYFVEVKDPDGANFPKYFWGYDWEERKDYIIKNHLTPGELRYKKACEARGGIYIIIYDKPSLLWSLGLKNRA